MYAPDCRGAVRLQQAVYPGLPVPPRRTAHLVQQQQEHAPQLTFCVNKLATHTWMVYIVRRKSGLFR